MITIIVFIFIIFPARECAIMEATIQIESDNLQISSFFERFKKFIAQSHGHQGNIEENNTLADFVQHNDSFQANYNFTQNLLTIGSSYSLLINGTNKKISDVKLTLNFRFKQDSNERIIIEDLHGNAVPRIGLDDRSKREEIWNLGANAEESSKDEYDLFSLPGLMLSFVVDVTEPVVTAFIHIIINGILGHILTRAFEEFYYGRLTT